MNKIIYSSFLLFSFLVNSQNPDFNTENINPSIGDLKATFYPKDSLAEAFYIYEEGFSEIDENHDHDLVTKYSAKIKIFNKEGFDEANIEIPMMKNDRAEEKIINLKAVTYNLEDGKQVKHYLNSEDVFTEEHDNHAYKKFTFPDVKPGSVLVYSYEKVSPFIFDFTTWKFQDYIPKAYSKFTAKIPANYEYYSTLRGGLKLKTDSSRVVKRCISFGLSANLADCIETIYDMENIPSFKPEKYLTSERNYKSRIEYELKQITRLDGYVKKYTKEWEDVDKELETNKSIGKQLRKDRLVAELLPNTISSLPNNLEKAKKIYYYVQEEFKWNEEYSIYADMKIKDILQDKTGNVLELNALLYNFYESEGFSVFPVMSATRGKGFPSKLHPVLSDFNYFFIQLNLDQEEYLLDVTEKYLDFGRLPFRALNSYARLIDFENGSSWIDIQPEEYSMFVYRDSLKINPDGSSKGYSIQVLNGYHALNLRKKIKRLNENEIFNQVTRPLESTRATGVEVSNQNDKSQKLEIKFSLNNQSQKINNKIYFNPFSFKFIEDNPFKQENRTYPIDFGYKDFYMYSAVIEIPEGYKVLELPKTKNLRLQGDGASLNFAATQSNDRTINVQCRLKFPYAIYPAKYHVALQKFFDQILEVQNLSLIVLEENS